MAILKKPYEISIWEDEIVDSGTDSSYYKEKKIAIIGTDTMTAPSKAFSPVLHIKNNGEVTFTFSMAHRYYDPSAEEEVVNPFISYMVNERKVKLYYDGKWYDFLIKNHEEDSESNVWTFTLTDAFVNELSKVGYNVEFSTELNNNQGTAEELAQETLKNTDWQVGESDELVQRVKEPMYIYEVTEGDLTVVDVEDTSDPKQEITVEEGEVIYVFYSYIANKNVKFVQFMREIDKPSFIYDSNNVIIGKNYRITEDVTYDDNEVPSFTIGSVTVSPVLEGGLPQYVPNQGFRLAYDQLTTYDPVMERTVKIYEIKDQDEGENQQVYSFDDSIYTTSTVLTSYITDGSDFNVYEDGSLEGWSNATVSTTKDGGVSKLQEIGLTTYPEVKPTVPLISLNEFSKIDGYLELKFDNPTNSSYENTIYNSGFENNASFIERVLMGEEYVLRIAAATANSKHGELTPLNLATSTGKIRAVVAKYERIEETSGDKRQYVRRILPDGVVINFNGDFVRDDVIVGDGVFNDSKTQYIIDGVVVEIPSTHCVYKDKDSGEQRVWKAPTSESDTGSFVLLENANWFVGYYRTVGTAEMPLSNSWLTKPTNKIGIFLYVDNADLCGGKYVYIADTQLTRCVRDGDNNIMSIGNVPTSVISTTPSYYQKPEKGQAAEDVDIYHELKDLASEIGCSPDDIVPVYNEKSEKILSISEAQSNCFNILQSICETFECWLKIDVKHNNDGSLKLDNNNKPIKQVCFKEYAGKNNFTGFKYGINLNSIQRTLNSDEIVTKLLVENVQSDYVDEGVMTIRNASTNPSGEANILNFDYYVNQGLIADREKYQEDLNNYYVQMKEYNNELNTLEAERSALEVALTRTDSNRNVYTETVDVAQDKYQEAQDIFKDITGMTYDEYMHMYTVAIGNTFTDSGATGSPVTGTVLELGYTTYTGTYYRFIRLHCENYDRYTLYKRKNDQWIRVFYRNDPNEAESKDVAPPSTTGDSKEYNIPWRRAVANSNDDPDGDHGEIELIDHEEIIDTIGQLYTSLSIINNYAGSILVNTDEEYERYRSKLEGYPDYKFTVSYVSIAGEEGSYEVRLVLSDYIKGFKFKTYVNGGAEQEFESSVSKKSFVATYDSVGESPTFTFKVTSIPENYEPVNFELNTSYVVANGIKGYTIKSNNTEVVGYKDRIKQVQNQKDACEKEFYKKYSRFIKEGTWSSNDYIDPELYYLDAMQVSQTSAFPKVEYSINVAEISELEGLENYKFDVGDKTYIEDTDFFGWAAFYVNNDSQIATLDHPNTIDGYIIGKTPAREEVIVAEVEWHLDEPEINVITVQNYKTRFEDLFQRISATVQQAQYNEATYAKTSSIIDANGTINQGVLLNSLNGLINSNYTLTSNGSVIVDNDGILIRDLNDTSNRVRIDSFGLKISRDGGQSWITAINGDGINLNRVVSGELNTKAIRIGNPDNPSFCWDDYGISAYRYNTTAEEEDSPYDLTTFVRYDQYGLYGIKNDSNFKASKLDDILDKAYFGVTWDGFFIKNSYEDGGRVEITSDDDFRVLTRPANSQTEQEKIKIGALEWVASGYRLTEDTSPISGKTYYIYNSADDTYSVSTPPDPIPSDTYYEYFNNEVTTEPQIDSAPTKYGIRIKNDAGEPVFTTDDDGNITLSGTIKSDNYIHDQSGWIIDRTGNAEFNNVSVRGTIKSVVFEYNQIQAVGGIIYVRPSTAITKIVGFDNDDLIVEVENVSVLSNNNFCRISGSAGPYYLYTVNNDDQVVLDDYGESNTPPSEGAALVTLGQYTNNITTNNLGIGLNSSDSDGQLPARAITLVESNYAENDSAITVNNIIKGVFGELPSSGISSVDSTIYNLIKGKQGIYTDNIYIGDASQYLAFYTDTNLTKKLVIKAAEVKLESGNSYVDLADTALHFWFNTTAQSSPYLPAGLYVTNQLIDSFKIDPTGGNTLLTNDGIYLRDGDQTLGSFTTTDGMLIGLHNQGHSKLTSNYYRMYSDSTHTYLSFDNIQENNLVLLNSYMCTLEDESKSTITLTTSVSSAFTANNLVVKANNQTLPVSTNYYSYTLSDSYLTVTFTTAYGGGQFTEGDELAVYSNESSQVMSFTFGSRMSSFGGIDYQKGVLSTTLGMRNIAQGSNSFAQGTESLALGSNSNATGYQIQALGFGSHAEGYQTLATGFSSHVEGFGNQAINGAGAHAEGFGTIASGKGAHAEGGIGIQGVFTEAKGDYSHAEGDNTFADGDSAHSEGYYTKSLNVGAHAQNVGTIASKYAQTAIGKYNEEDSNTIIDPDTYHDRGKYVFIIGNGTQSTPSNALTVDWDGNVTSSGTITVGNHAQYIGYRTTVSSGTFQVNHNSATVPTNSQLTRLTLGAGSWIVYAGAQFPSNSTGRRYLTIYNVTDDVGISRSEVTVPAASGSETRITTMVAVGGITVSVRVYQNSGSNLNVTCYLHAIRIS